MLKKLWNKLKTGFKKSSTVWLATIGSTLMGAYLSFITVLEPLAPQVKEYVNALISTNPKTAAVVGLVYMVSLIAARMRTL